MTDKDIRDIAAYLYARYFCIAKTEYGTILEWSGLVIQFIGIVDNNGIEFINDNYSQLKLRLRPIASLTDEEWRQCFKQAYPAYICKTVERSGEDYYLSDGDGLTLCVKCGPHYAGFYVRAYVGNDESTGFEAADLIHYLQSIGVYVPGTVNPDYVEPQPL